MRLSKLVLLFTLCVPSWGAWSHYIPLTNAHAQCGSATSSNFPALIYGSDSTLKDVAHGGYVNSSSGADIEAFSTSGMTTQIASDLDYYDNVNGILWMWVQISCSSSADQTIYLAVGNASPPARTTGVWSAASAVYHMGTPSSLSLADSGPSSQNAANTGLSASSGKIGGAMSSTGTSTYATLPGAGAVVSAFRASNFSASFWLNLNSYGSWDDIRFLSTSGAYGVSIVANSEYQSDLEVSCMGLATVIFGKTALPSAGGWHHIVVSHTTDGGGTTALYLDGSAVSAGDSNYYANASSGSIWTLGSTDGVGLNGYMDEVHIWPATLSADWITGEYNNQNSPGNIGAPGFWTWGSWQSLGGSARRRVVIVQ